MALGYEGYVKIKDKYALGTGTAVPRARVRLDSQGAYGGQISSPVTEIGIGAPRVYDWETFDGSLSFEVTKDIFAVLKEWVYARDAQRDILFSTRKTNEQKYVDTFWNSISMSASEGALVDGSLGFVAIEQDSYDYGTIGLNAGYAQNKDGAGLLCPLATGMPPPLNKEEKNYNPIPYWYTKVTIGGQVFDFVTWSLDFSQDVVKFFASNKKTGPQGPVHVGVGPMTVTFSGSWMWVDTDKPSAYPDDSPTTAKVEVADLNMSFKKLELQTSSDDVQSPDSTTPVQIEYAIYELDNP